MRTTHGLIMFHGIIALVIGVDLPKELKNYLPPFFLQVMICGCFVFVPFF